MNEKERYIPVNGKKVNVSEAVFKAYYRPIWNTYRHEKRYGNCAEPSWRNCKGDCFDCPSHCGTEFEPLPELDYFSYSTDTIVEDVAAIVIDKETFEEIFRLADEFDPQGKLIFQLVASGVTEREAAKIFLISQPTFNRRKNTLLNNVREHLQK